MSSFIAKLRSPQFVACIDTGHAQLTGTPPAKLISGMNKNLVKCLHLHDNDGKDDLHSLPYTGVLNFDKIAETLRKVGYQGDVTLEIPYFLEKFTDGELPDALALSAKVADALRRKIGGGKCLSGFSATTSPSKNCFSSTWCVRSPFPCAICSIR
jgi:sugar phosphate isomerase/epimerase